MRPVKGKAGKGKHEKKAGREQRKGEEKVEKQELTHSVIPNLLSEPTLFLSQNSQDSILSH